MCQHYLQMFNTVYYRLFGNQQILALNYISSRVFLFCEAFTIIKTFLEQRFINQLTLKCRQEYFFTQLKDMSLVRRQAPKFEVNSYYKGDFKTIKLEDYKGKYLVLFFYPLDFTFVCPTEIIAFSNKAKQFRELGCEVVACSVDSHFSHMEYCLKSRKDGGLGEMEIPLLSDINKTISRDYGCLIEEGPDAGISFRATYIIDGKGIVRHASVNDLPVGRNPDEFLRLVKAFQFVDQHGEVCPANWQPGQKTMIPDPKKNNYKEVISEAK